MNTIGENLKRCRKECGYTPRKLAELCGLDVEYVKEIEAGNAVPFPETVKELANAVRVRPERLYGIAPLNENGGIITRTVKNGNEMTIYILYGKDYELTGTYTDKNGIAAKFREREAEENDG